MGDSKSRWSMVRWKRPKKDYLIKGAIVLAVVVFILYITPIVQGVKMTNRYHRYIEELTNSVNHAHKNGGVTVEYQGETFRLEKERLSALYSIIVTTGMGKIQKSPPEGADLYTLSFPDGSKMLICETDIPEESRISDVGVYFSYTNVVGEVYQYDTDLIDPGIIRKTIRK